ncbi:MAG: TIGR00266 family protein [Candidatus Aenigmatarchaeota archaeon]|nr:MAG: TIGR00266 family protein [Candidatus Aenigmarchaeota archaeon]
MDWYVEKGPAYPVLVVELGLGEAVVAEAGAMMAMEGNINVETRTAGGLGRAILRKLTAGESIFVNTFRGGEGGGKVWLAPSVPGVIVYAELKDSGIVIQDTSYLAHHGDVDYELKWKGLKGLLAEKNLVWLRLHGTGGVWFNSYGGIIEKELKPDEQLTVDTGHLVAFQDTIDFSIGKFGGWKSFMFGGEGLTIKLKGPGKVYIQTRILPPLAEALSRFLPKR